MPAFLANIGAAFAGNALKWGACLVLLLGVAAGGFVWGDNHATAIAITSATRDADARVAAAQKSDSVILADYVAKLSAQSARGEALSAALAASQAKLSAAAGAAKENIAHAISQNTSCDLPAAAVSLLNAQPARH